MGTGSIIVAGGVQRMSAGSGVLHSEYNPSLEQPVHALQIWIEPNVTASRRAISNAAFPPPKNAAGSG